MARLFSATAMGGRLYLPKLSEGNPRAPRQLVYYPEEAAQFMAARHPHDRLMSSAEELRRLARPPGWPAFEVWIREDLEDEARRIWEERQGC